MIILSAKLLKIKDIYDDGIPEQISRDDMKRVRHGGGEGDGDRIEWDEN